MRMSIKLVGALDAATVHERVVDVSEDGRIGKFVDELFERCGRICENTVRENIAW
jgi:hypothetical protein